jgi:hypothetical protein
VYVYKELSPCFPKASIAPFGDMPCLVVCAYTHQEVHPLALLSFPKEGKFALQRSKPKRKVHKRDFFLLSLFVFVQLKIVPFALLKGREKTFMVLKPYKLNHHIFGEEKT